MSVVIFAGSAEFVVASQLAGAFNPLATFAVVFIVNARHLFYGLSMLERFRNVGRKRAYLIFGMCDETFSITYATEPPAGIDRGWFMFWVTLLNQLYWVAGCTLGGIFGAVAATSVEGVSFAMTALFVVIFLDQWEKDSQHLSTVAGIACAAVALVAFGADGFMIPALALILLAVTMMRPRIEPAYPETEEAGALGQGPIAADGHSRASDATQPECAPAARKLSRADSSDSSSLAEHGNGGGRA